MRRPTPMSSAWLPPPPPPPAPKQPFDATVEADDELTEILIQGFFFCLLVACQNPQLTFISLRGCCASCDALLRHAWELATHPVQRERRSYEPLDGDSTDDVEAAAPSSTDSVARTSRVGSVARVLRVPRVRVVLHSKLSRFQSRFDAATRPSPTVGPVALAGPVEAEPRPALTAPAPACSSTSSDAVAEPDVEEAVSPIADPVTLAGPVETEPRPALTAPPPACSTSSSSRSSAAPAASPATPTASATADGDAVAEREPHPMRGENT